MKRIDNSVRTSSGNAPSKGMKRFPGGKSFAFTIYDDTDEGTVENLAPVSNLSGRWRMSQERSTGALRFKIRSILISSAIFRRKALRSRYTMSATATLRVRLCCRV